ncbi:hypothetical protein QPK87_22570 [Kamptonema cortianum]|jgi:cytochrome c-type biogenesis protein CcmH/NrfG|nr:hypothetical protein [Kamptonema cortianum]
MSQPTVPVKSQRSSRVTWLIVVAITLLALWFIYSATQASITTATNSTAPSMDGTATTSMQQSMPGMNH